MKRGEISLKALVVLIIHILPLVALLVILGVFVNSFLSSTKTVEERDFTRIKLEFDEIVKAPGKIVVPVSNPNGMILATYPPDNSPPSCDKKPCVCIYYKKDGKDLERCQIYDKLQDCVPNECGKACLAKIPPTTFLSERKSVTITRSCNAISIT